MGLVGLHVASVCGRFFLELSGPSLGLEAFSRIGSCCSFFVFIFVLHEGVEDQFVLFFIQWILRFLLIVVHF